MTSDRTQAQTAVLSVRVWRGERRRLRFGVFVLALVLNGLIVWIAFQTTSRAVRPRRLEPTIVVLTLPRPAQAPVPKPMVADAARRPPKLQPAAARPAANTSPARVPALPALALAGIPSLSASAPAGPDAPVVSGSDGVDSLPGLGENARLRDLRARGLDVMFVVDATGSMDWVLADITKRIREVVETLRSLAPLTRVGIAVYRDPDDPEFLVRIQPLTYSGDKLDGFLANLKASGGGGLQEAVDAGIEAAVSKAGWRKGAQAEIVLIGDAPPYDAAMGKIRRVVRSFVGSGGQISVIDVSDQANPELVERQTGRKVDHALYRRTPMYQFSLIAEAGGGTATTLRGDLELSRRLIGLVLGGEADSLLVAAAASSE